MPLTQKIINYPHRKKETISEELKKMLINWWVDKEDVIYMYVCNGILLSHKKWNLSFAIMCIDGTRECYAKKNKSVK